MKEISSNITDLTSMTAQQEKTAAAEFLKAIVSGGLWKNSGEHDVALNGSFEGFKAVNAADNDITTAHAESVTEPLAGDAEPFSGDADCLTGASDCLTGGVERYVNQFLARKAIIESQLELSQKAVSAWDAKHTGKVPADEARKRPTPYTAEQARIDEVEYFLSMAYRCKQQIKEIKMLIDDAEDSASIASSVIDGMPHTHDMLSRQDRLMERKEKLVNQYTSEMYALYDLYDMIDGIIVSVPNPKYREVLRLRHLKCLGWKDIAKQMSYETHYIHRLHKNALLACNLPTDEALEAAG